MKNPPEIKILIPAEKVIPADTRENQTQLLVGSKGVEKVSTAVENQLAGKSVVELRKFAKAGEDARLALTKPVNDAVKLVKEHWDEFLKPVYAEIDRLQKLGNNFIESENRRVADEERKRRQEFEAAQRKQFALDEAARKAAESGSIAQQMVANRKLEAAKANVQTIIAAPEPEMTKAKGQTTKQVLRHEVTDILALVKARPDLCKIEAKASAINSTCHPNLPIPGLRLWFETETIYTTR